MWTIQSKLGLVLCALSLGACSFSASAGSGKPTAPGDDVSGKGKPVSKTSDGKSSGTTMRSADAPDPNASDTGDSSELAARPSGPADGDKSKRCDNPGKKKGHDKDKAKGEAKGHDMCDD
jgi:hypothetical protein